MTIKARLPIPGLLCGMYPERKLPSKKSSFPISSLKLALARLVDAKERKAKRLIKKVRFLEKESPPFNSPQFNADLQSLQIAMRKEGFTEAHTAKAFALINQVYFNIMDVRLFDSQITTAYHLLNNRLTEMATGEGKTFAVALAAATAAISGVPIHVITANDYLAARDAHDLQLLYHALGLTVDAAIYGQEPVRRKQAYACDITYCTAKELAFDYLRDSLNSHKKPTAWYDESTDSTNPLLLRGLCMAIVDEADSIFIDEASVPLVLSEASQNQQKNDYFKQSLALAQRLLITQDFKLKKDAMQARLTTMGQEKLEAAASTLPAVWHNRLHREETVCQALAALYLYHRDQHYLVNNDAIAIIDETTGRIATGRSWSRGLHQLIEIKENCRPSASLSTVAQITYQRFFPRYFRLSGVSGTLLESRHELFQTYGLHVSKTPLRLPSQRNTLPTRLFKDQQQLRTALVERIATLQAKKRPILIGTASVIESELLANALQDAGIEHVVLNAKNDRNEANLIAKAGQAGAVTITTNMAGRGTDIKLEKSINALGGLHVISCQVNPSRRIDRQLIGRAARQGDNGSTETWVSLNTGLLSQKVPSWLRTFIKHHSTKIPSIIVNSMIRMAQISEERHQTLLRKQLLNTDTQLEKNLSFGKVQ